MLKHSVYFGVIFYINAIINYAIHRKIQAHLGAESDYLLGFDKPAVSKTMLHLPESTFIDQVYGASDRTPQVLRSLGQLFGTGRLADTGYLSILPVDQGIEHSAGASFAPNPQYFDPENIVKLALEGNCNAVASTFGVLGQYRENMHTRFLS
ncbi:hypothetical protein KUH03_09500 [Sphingobacterium sp. E70]|nr:hypothetical protein [Sphingobacterium sp. E70]ULT27020.1 hypothetical protein KUH03_09500 [Sphingobacterium sp. E70]